MTLQHPEMTHESVGNLLHSLRAIYDYLRTEVQGPLDLPGPALRLNLNARALDQTRMFKHLHQSCQWHAIAFKRVNEIKLLYLIDAYVRMSEPVNALGLFSGARLILEFNAFLYEVTRRLLEVSKGDVSQWRQRGEQFFSVIVRARYATSDPQLLTALNDMGLGKATLKPFNVMHCLETLTQEPRFANIRARYDRLCDFVHHNFSSQTVSQSGMSVGTVARSTAGGKILVSQPVPIYRYEYPAEGAARRALAVTIQGAIEDVQACLSWLNPCPEHPFTQEELIKCTGISSGVSVSLPTESSNTIRTSQREQVGRNRPSPCGRGRISIVAGRRQIESSRASHRISCAAYGGLDSTATPSAVARVVLDTSHQLLGDMRGRRRVLAYRGNPRPQHAASRAVPQGQP